MTSKVIKVCDDNLSAVALFSLYEISQLAFLWSRFDQIEITK